MASTRIYQSNNALFFKLFDKCYLKYIIIQTLRALEKHVILVWFISSIPTDPIVQLGINSYTSARDSNQIPLSGKHKYR